MRCVLALRLLCAESCIPSNKAHSRNRLPQGNGKANKGHRAYLIVCVPNGAVSYLVEYGNVDRYKGRHGHARAKAIHLNR